MAASKDDEISLKIQWTFLAKIYIFSHKVNAEMDATSSNESNATIFEPGSAKMAPKSIDLRFLS